MGASVLGGLDGTGLVSTESAVIINDGCCVLVLLEGDGAIIPFAESWSMLTVYEEEFQIRNGPRANTATQKKLFFNFSCCKPAFPSQCVGVGVVVMVDEFYFGLLFAVVSTIRFRNVA